MFGLLQNFIVIKAFDSIFNQIAKEFNTNPVKVIAVNATVLYVIDENSRKIIPKRIVQQGEVIGNHKYSGVITTNGRKLKVVKVHNVAYKQDYIVIHNDVKFKKNAKNVIR